MAKYCYQFFFLPFTRQGEYVKEFKRARRRDDDIALVNADVHSAFFKLQLPSGPLIENSPGIKPGTLIACDRVCIPGLQRLQHLKKYAHSRRVKVQYSEGISKLNPTKIEICFHRNASLGLGQCLQNEWKALDKGSWTALMSPFETKFIDIRMPGTLFDSLTISVEETEKHNICCFVWINCWAWVSNSTLRIRIGSFHASRIRLW